MLSRFPSKAVGFSPFEAVTHNGKVSIRDKETNTGETPEGSIIQKLNFSYMSDKPEAKYNPEIIYNWEPYQKLVPVHHDSGKPYTTNQLNAKRKASQKSGIKYWNPNHFVNPYQDLDYMIMMGVTQTTFVGSMMNTLTRFIMGTGFHPDIELIDPSGDEDEDAKTLKDYKHVVDFLKSIDSYVDRRVEGRNDVPLIENVAMMIDSTNIFNRAALMFVYDDEDQFVDSDGKTWKEVPTALRYAHPRDLGIIETHEVTQGLTHVQWREEYEMISVSDMIYLWNPLISAKYNNSMFYGGSMILPMLDAARSIRSLIGTDFPAMARNTWAGMPIVVVMPQGQTDEEKVSEYTEIVNRFVVGGANILLEDPANVTVHNIDFEPKVMEFQKLVDFLARYCVASAGLPQTLFFDETTSTRSTMLGKIQLAMSVTIEPVREQFNRQINPQWYQRWFEMKYGGTDTAKKIKTKLVWNDLHVEKWFDKVEASNMLDARLRLKNKAYGELTGIPNYTNMVVDNSDVVPGGDPSQLEPRDPPDSRLETRGKEAK